MFIVIDGIDGSGKGTQLERVKNALEKQGKKVHVLDFPRYGNPSAYSVEKYLNGKYGTDVSAKQASIFYALDRFDASIDFGEIFQEYDYVISNRYVSASMIHQGGKIQDKNERIDFLHWLEDLEYSIFKIPKPDLTIFLDVSPQMSNILVEKKQKRDYILGRENKDLHEADSSHMVDAYNSAKEIVEAHPDWIEVSCEQNGEMQSIDTITEMILETINKKQGTK